MSSPLKTPLRKTPIHYIFRSAVIEQVWAINIGPIAYDEQKEAYEAYFHHVYQEQCDSARPGDHENSLWTHSEVLKLVKCLKLERFQNTPVSQLPKMLDTTALATERVVKLAASLFLPLHIGGIGGARRGATVTWLSDESLSNVLHKTFAQMESRTLNSSCASCSAQTVFPRSFSARNLEYIAGFDIIWTSNLLDHLLVVDTDDKISVYIYHQVNFLENTRHISSLIIPEELIIETIDTLSLLLPRQDRAVRKWFRKLQKSHKLDPGAITSKYLDMSEREIDHYHFWKERLIKLKKAFDDHEPKGAFQWWRDDRRSVQWWTFWIAAMVLFLTIFFGLVQSITGVLQVIRS